jgi:hypothetical protein
MHANRSEEGQELPCGLSGHVPEQDIAANAILSLLLSPGYQGPWTVSDLKGWLSSSEFAVDEALIDLQNAALICVHEEIVFARLAARHMNELDL